MASRADLWRRVVDEDQGVSIVLIYVDDDVVGEDRMVSYLFEE